MEQYRRGERFVAGVHAAGGDAAIGHLWDGPASLPTDAEMDEPRRWVQRVLPVALGVRGRPGAAGRGQPDARASGPGGVPTAIALTPILSARYREADLERIRAAAPGARLVTVSLEGLADGPLDDIEVMLRGPLPAATFERILVRAPRLAWVHSATAGVERVLIPAAAGRGLVITNARGVFSDPSRNTC